MRCIDVLLGDDCVGIVGPVLRFADGRLQSGAARLTRWRRAPDVLHDPGPRSIDSDWVTGAAMFIRREVALQVGMDGSYFLGAEDADFCIRTWRAGWRVVCCGDAPVTHHRSRIITPATWQYYSTRNRVWFTRSAFGPVPATLNLLVALATVPRVALADLVRRHDFDTTRLLLLGILHSFLKKPHPDSGAGDDEPVLGRLRTSSAGSNAGAGSSS